MASDGPGRSAAYRNLGIYLVGQALSNVGSFSQTVALSLLVLELSGSGLALGATLAGVALAPTPTAFLARMPCFGAAVVAYTATAQSLTQRRAPREMVGRMMSLFTLGSMGTTPLGGLIVGFVIDHASPRAAVGLGAAGATLVGLVLALR